MKLYEKISDVITTQIEPNPQDEITTEVRFDEKKALIVLNISKGGRNIYCQKKIRFFFKWLYNPNWNNL